MVVRIKAHFDGKTIVPDEPVSVPAGTPATVEFSQGAFVQAPAGPAERRAALERVIRGAVDGPGLPLEATRRENMYEDR